MAVKSEQMNKQMNKNTHLKPFGITSYYAFLQWEFTMLIYRIWHIAFYRYGGGFNMAEELRWRVLKTSGAGAVTNGENANEFKNETARTLFIRRIQHSHRATTMAPGEEYTVEISKSPAYAFDEDQSSQFTSVLKRGMPATGATPGDGVIEVNFTELFAKGQLELEPGESLHVNWSKSADPVLAMNHIIGYHF